MLVAKRLTTGIITFVINVHKTVHPVKITSTDGNKSYIAPKVSRIVVWCKSYIAPNVSRIVVWCKCYIAPNVSRIVVWCKSFTAPNVPRIVV